MIKCTQHSRIVAVIQRKPTFSLNSILSLGGSSVPVLLFQTPIKQAKVVPFCPLCLRSVRQRLMPHAALSYLRLIFNGCFSYSLNKSEQRGYLDFLLQNCFPNACNFLAELAVLHHYQDASSTAILVEFEQS